MLKKICILIFFLIFTGCANKYKIITETGRNIRDIDAEVHGICFHSYKKGYEIISFSKNSSGKNQKTSFKKITSINFKTFEIDIFFDKVIVNKLSKNKLYLLYKSILEKETETFLKKLFTFSETIIGQEHNNLKLKLYYVSKDYSYDNVKKNYNRDYIPLSFYFHISTESKNEFLASIYTSFKTISHEYGHARFELLPQAKKLKKLMGDVSFFSEEVIVRMFEYTMVLYLLEDLSISEVDLDEKEYFLSLNELSFAKKYVQLYNESEAMLFVNLMKLLNKNTFTFKEDQVDFVKISHSFFKTPIDFTQNTFKKENLCDPDLTKF